MGKRAFQPVALDRKLACRRKTFVNRPRLPIDVFLVLCRREAGKPSNLAACVGSVVHGGHYSTFYRLSVTSALPLSKRCRLVTAARGREGGSCRPPSRLTRALGLAGVEHQQFTGIGPQHYFGEERSFPPLCRSICGFRAGLRCKAWPLSSDTSPPHQPDLR